MIESNIESKVPQLEKITLFSKQINLILDNNICCYTCVNNDVIFTDFLASKQNKHSLFF